jgi:hypothetical protein
MAGDDPEAIHDGAHAERFRVFGDQPCASLLVP